MRERTSFRKPFRTEHSIERLPKCTLVLMCESHDRSEREEGANNGLLWKTEKDEEEESVRRPAPRVLGTCSAHALLHVTHCTCARCHVQPEKAEAEVENSNVRTRMYSRMHTTLSAQTDAGREVGDKRQVLLKAVELGTQWRGEEEEEVMSSRNLKDLPKSV